MIRLTVGLLLAAFAAAAPAQDAHLLQQRAGFAHREMQQAMSAAQLRYTAPMSLRRRIEMTLPSPWLEWMRKLSSPMTRTPMCSSIGRLSDSTTGAPSVMARSAALPFPSAAPA